jgi:hypothetical protein
MKKMFLITYDFKNEEIPKSFFETLQHLGSWWHFINGSWLVSTELDAGAIQDRLADHLDENVNLLIVEAGREMSGWLPKNAWDWIRENRANRELASTFGATG